MQTLNCAKKKKENYFKRSIEYLILLLFLTSCSLSFPAAYPSPVLAQSESKVEWEWRNPLPQGNNLLAVTWGGNQFVAVGFFGGWEDSSSWKGNGVVFTSPDGVRWRESSLGIDNAIYDVTWGGNQFVAVGNKFINGLSAGGEIYTSPDGIKWTKRNTDTMVDLNGVSWGGNQFVAVGDGNAIITSTDGIRWTERSLGNDYFLCSVVWGGGQYVAVGDRDFGGVILTSSDGVNWKELNMDTSTLRSVTWGNNQFVVVEDPSGFGGGSGSIFTSSDGVRWTKRISGIGLHSVTWGDSQYVGVGNNGAIYASPDGIKWTKQNSGTSEHLRGITWSGNQFIIVGGSAILSSSPAISSPLPDIEPETYSIGDVTGNGRIDAEDATRVSQHVLGLKYLSDNQKKVADVNSDGIIDVRDILLIIQYALKKIDKFPIEQ